MAARRRRSCSARVRCTTSICALRSSRALSMAMAACAAMPTSDILGLLREDTGLIVAEEQAAMHLAGLRDHRHREIARHRQVAFRQAEMRRALAIARILADVVGSHRPQPAEGRLEQFGLRGKPSLPKPRAALRTAHRACRIRSPSSDHVVEERAELRAGDFGRDSVTVCTIRSRSRSLEMVRATRLRIFSRCFCSRSERCAALKAEMSTMLASVRSHRSPSNATVNRMRQSLAPQGLHGGFALESPPSLPQRHQFLDEDRLRLRQDHPVRGRRSSSLFSAANSSTAYSLTSLTRTSRPL